MLKEKEAEQLAKRLKDERTEWTNNMVAQSI